MPFDPELANRMRRALKSLSGIQERNMFGGLCWMLRGNMLCGVEGGRFMFRVGKGLEEEALSRPGATPMDFTGKPMRGFVWVSASETEGKRLTSWIELATSFVSTLHPK